MEKPQNSKTSRRLAALLLCALSATVVQAEVLNVLVLDSGGLPVPEVAVFVNQDGVAATATSPGTAIMDQRDTQFVPHMLLVRTGTLVEFPNSDVVAHHVYSFSKPNNFVLPLYKGDPHEPIVFEHDGVVTLGCNIHDDMLGYIVVVDTEVFGITDQSGRVALNVSSAATRQVVNVWSPRIRDKQNTLSKVVDNSSVTDEDIVFGLQKKLRAPHNESSEAVAWSDY